MVDPSKVTFTDWLLLPVYAGLGLVILLMNRCLGPQKPKYRVIQSGDELGYYFEKIEK